MIKQLKIGNFRGIRAGTIENFSALNVLVGPSGSGKSTVIDALYLAGSPKLDEAQRPDHTPLNEITTRRGSAGPASMPAWLLWKHGRDYFFRHIWEQPEARKYLIQEMRDTGILQMLESLAK